MAIQLDKIKRTDEHVFTSTTNLDLPESNQPEQDSTDTAQTLHQLFSIDVLNRTTADIIIQPMVIEPSTSTFWGRILSWFQSFVSDPTDSVADPMKNSLPIDRIEPLSPIPVLEPPKDLSVDIASQFPPPSIKTDISKLSDSEIAEGLKRMSQLTMEQIFQFIFKEQMEQELERAKVAETTFLKNQEFKKYQEKILREIKEILIKDEGVANYFKTVQNAAVAANFLSGIIATALRFDLFSGAPRTILSIATLIASSGTAVTAGLVALTTGTKSYFDRKLIESKAKNEDFSHRDNFCDASLDKAREIIEKIGGSDLVFKDCFARLIKSSHKMKMRVLASR